MSPRYVLAETGGFPSLSVRYPRRVHAQRISRTDAILLALVKESLHDLWDASSGPAARTAVAPSRARRKSPRQTIHETILTFLSLEPGWGEPHYVTPSRSAVDDALRFLDRIPADCLLPHVSPAGDGEVNFCWRRDGLFIDVGFYGDGKICYYARVDASGLDKHDERDFSQNEIPRELLSAIPSL